MRRKARPAPRTFECPHCGASVRAGAKVCRECGSDADTGWQDDEEIQYQSLDLPTGYSRDPEHPGGIVSERRSPWLIVTAVVVAAAFLWWALGWVGL